MNRKRWTLRNKQRTLRNLRKRDLNGFLQLRIATRDDISRSDFDVEIRSDANVFYAPRRPAGIVRGTIREPYLSSVDQRRSKVIRTNATAESALADGWTNLRQLEHERTRFRR